MMVTVGRSCVDDTSRVLFVIYNTEFDEWIKTEEPQNIEDKSKLRVIFSGSFDDQKNRESTGTFKRKGVQSVKRKQHFY